MPSQDYKDRDGSAVDPYHIRKLYKPLRVVDVCDAMDGIGYFNIGNVDQSIRPLWLGMKFWGVAVTLRAVPSNAPMWKLDSTEDIVRAHGIWFEKMGNPASKLNDHVKEGSVVVMDCGGADNVGFWGSENSLGVVEKGGVGIITNGQCRDTGEVTLQKTPIACKSRGRTIIPGRIMPVEVQSTIGVGGAQVRPGDIVGLDDDGIVVVPIEVAREVALHAKEVLLADMRARGAKYGRLGMPRDETVDTDAVDKYYADLGA